MVTAVRRPTRSPQAVIAISGDATYAQEERDFDSTELRMVPSLESAILASEDVVRRLRVTDYLRLVLERSRFVETDDPDYPSYTSSASTEETIEWLPEEWRRRLAELVSEEPDLKQAAIRAAGLLETIIATPDDAVRTASRATFITTIGTGVQVEWQLGDRYAEIEVPPKGELIMLTRKDGNRRTIDLSDLQFLAEFRAFWSEDA